MRRIYPEATESCHFIPFLSVWQIDHPSDATIFIAINLPSSLINSVSHRALYVCVCARTNVITLNSAVDIFMSNFIRSLLRCVASLRHVEIKTKCRQSTTLFSLRTILGNQSHLKCKVFPRTEQPEVQSA